MSKMHIENLLEIDMGGNIDSQTFSIMFYPIGSGGDIIGINLADGKVNLVKRVSNKWSTIWSK